ncbi:MAG TPA: hypothetical protein DDZ89_05315, partial [Clostridiales bacterium]|nr:hypothetical protein [Clostridiales bacterium]
MTEKMKDECGYDPVSIMTNRFLDQVPVMIYKINTSMICNYVNSKWMEFTGLSVQESLGYGLLKAVHSDDLDQCRKVLFEGRHPKKPYHFKARMLRNDGVYRICHFEGKPYTGDDNEYAGFVGTITDLSDMRAPEETLNRYQLLAEITDNIILFIDLDGHIVDANNAAIKAYGYTYEELCSLDIFDIRADQEDIKEQMETANQEGVFFEAMHRRKDGSIMNVEVSSRVVFQGHKRLLGSIIRDITERKKTEETLREKDELFRTIYEQSPVGVAFTTSYGEIINGNPRYEQILGRTIDELSLLGWKHITHPDDLYKDKEKLERYIAGEEKFFYTQKRYIKPDGSVVWCSLTLAPLSNHINLTMINDITELIQTYEKLQESEKLKEVMLSNMPGMSYRCKYDRQWTMEYISDGCYALTGYMPESLLHNKELSFNDLIDEEYREYLWDQWTQQLKVKGPVKVEYSMTTATGETKWVFEQGRGIYGEDGMVVGLEGLVVDMTDQKRKEDEIKFLHYHDVLTGLYNRKYFKSKIDELDRVNVLPVSIIVGDINGLKSINNTFGYAKGDHLLVTIGKILETLVLDQGLVARTSGGDFSIVLPGMSNDKVIELMNRLESACNRYLSKSKNTANQASISFGCATKECKADSLAGIVKKAEDSMVLKKLL